MSPPRRARDGTCARARAPEAGLPAERVQRYLKSATSRRCCAARRPCRDGLAAASMPLAMLFLLAFVRRVCAQTLAPPPLPSLPPLGVANSSSDSVINAAPWQLNTAFTCPPPCLRPTSLSLTWCANYQTNVKLRRVGAGRRARAASWSGMGMCHLWGAHAAQRLRLLRRRRHGGAGDGCAAGVHRPDARPAGAAD